MFQCGFLWRFPEVAFQVHTRLNDFDAFAFEEFSLEGSVRLADEDFAALADNAMPGNAFAGRVAAMARPAVRAPPGRRRAFASAP